MTFTRTHILGIVSACIGAYIIFISIPSPQIFNGDSTSTSIVAFGDSLVQGMGSTPGNDLFSILSGRIDQPIINLGVSGDTTRDALGRLQEVLDRDPRLVIIILGGNDYIKRYDPDTTFTNLATIVDTIHAAGSAVLLLGVRGGVLTDTYKDRFKDFAREKHTGYIPNILDGLIGNSTYMADIVHPNDAGYLRIADKVEPVLTQILER